ncbi:MAG: phosphoribosylanthranilate isomerase [Armatimonadota bacterium]|jgi:phosphoribosylanthranilate isomerase
MPGERPVLKVCGLTRVADIRCAEAAGADFCGFITEIERSPRCVTREQATLLARACRARPVLVVEGMPPDEIAALVEVVRPHAVQLHGGDADYIREVAETLDAMAQVTADRLGACPTTTGARGERRPVGCRTGCQPVAAEVWRPIGLPERAEDREALVEETLAEIEAALEAGASAIVLDTRTSEGTGGSGRTCDWEAAAEVVRRCDAPVLLAGGLGPENLREALEATGAAGADLSSSLEASPGRKSPARLRELGRAWATVICG